MPTYAAVGPSISFSSVPGMMSWIMPLHLSSSTKFFICILRFLLFDLVTAICKYNETTLKLEIFFGGCLFQADLDSRELFVFFEKSVGFVIYKYYLGKR